MQRRGCVSGRPHSGSWHASNESSERNEQRVVTASYDEDTSLEFSRSGSETYRLTVARADRELQFECRIAVAGEQQFLQLQRLPDGDAADQFGLVRPYYFARCVISDDAIRLVSCDPSAFRVVADELGMPHVESDSMLLFAGTTEELHQLLDAHASELFVESGDDAVLRRQANR